MLEPEFQCELCTGRTVLNDTTTGTNVHTYIHVCCFQIYVLFWEEWNSYYDYCQRVRDETHTYV